MNQTDTELIHNIIKINKTNKVLNVYHRCQRQYQSCQEQLTINNLPSLDQIHLKSKIINYNQYLNELVRFLIFINKGINGQIALTTHNQFVKSCQYHQLMKKKQILF